MNPKSLPLDLNSGGISAAFAGADEIPLTTGPRRSLAFCALRYEETRRLYVCRPLSSCAPFTECLAGRSDLGFEMHEPYGFKDWNDQLRFERRPEMYACR